MNLSDAIRWQIKNWKVLLVIGLVASVPSIWMVATDPHTNAAEHYIQANSDLIYEIGNIEDITLINTVTHFRSTGVGAAKEPGSKHYRFVAKGNKATAVVTVIVEIAENNGIASIRVEKVEL